MQDEHFIRIAIEESRIAASEGNYPYGAVLVADGREILRGHNLVVTRKDISHHAELGLLKEACARFNAEIMGKATLYSSCEPCAMCSGAIYWSGISRLVYGCSTQLDADISEMPFAIPCRSILQQPGARAIEVVGPILEQEAFSVLSEFWPRVLRQSDKSFGLSI